MDTFCANRVRFAIVSFIRFHKIGNLPDAPGMRCYVLCLMEHSGIINDQAMVNFSKIYHLFTPSIRESFQIVTEKCNRIRKFYQSNNTKSDIDQNVFSTKIISFADGDTRCDTAYLTLKCMFKAIPEVNRCLEYTNQE